MKLFTEQMKGFSFKINYCISSLSLVLSINHSLLFFCFFFLLHIYKFSVIRYETIT